MAISSVIQKGMTATFHKSHPTFEEDCLRALVVRDKMAIPANAQLIVIHDGWEFFAWKDGQTFAIHTDNPEEFEREYKHYL